VLRHIAQDGRAWIARAGEIADHYYQHHYAEAAHGA